MSCHEIEKELSAYLDGELSPKEAVRVRGHVAQCPACARELERLRRVITAVRELPEVPAPEGLKQKILDELAAGERVRRKPAGVSRLRMLWPTAAAVAIAALLAWYGGLFRPREARRAAAPTTEVARLARPTHEKALRDDLRAESAGRTAKKGAYRGAERRGTHETTPTLGAMAERGKAPPAARPKAVTGKGPTPAFKLSEKGLSEAPALAGEGKAGGARALQWAFTGGAWELVSADPAAARARVAAIVKQAGLRVVAPPERYDAEVMQRRAAGPSPMVIELTSEQWAKLLAELKKAHLTPVRKSSATQLARHPRRRETADKLRGLRERRADKKEKASFDLKRENVPTQAAPAGEERVRKSVSASRQQVERFRVRLFFRPANVPAVKSPAGPRTEGEAETEPPKVKR